MKVTKLQIAIVGAGLMGRWHSQAAQYLGANIDAIVDSNQDAAIALARKFKTARVFTSLKEYFVHDSPDIVHVCTPVNSHFALVEQSLKAGCHVLVEKPLATSVRDTKKLIAIARERSLQLNPIHQFPFQRGFLQIISQREQLGKLVSVNHCIYSAGGTGKSSLECRSILLEILPHSVSLFYQIFGDDFDSSTLQVLLFSDRTLKLIGQVGETDLSLVFSLEGRPTRNELHLVGTKKTAYLDLFQGYGLFEPGQVSRQTKIIKPFHFGTQLLFVAGFNLIRRTIQSELAYPGLRELIRRFYNAVTNHDFPPISEAEILTIANVMDIAKKY